VARRGRPPGAPGGALRLRVELVRTLATLDREIERGIGPVGLPPEAVHDLHRELRRLASGLAVWARLVPADAQAGIEEISQRVRRLARLVGRVRDRDVTLTLLAPAARRRPRSEELGAWHEFLRRLREDGHTGRELLQAFLRTERQGGLFERARGVLELTPRADADRGLHQILGEERRFRQGRVRKAHRKARRRPTSERLHRLRIRIRQWRHLASLELAADAAATQPPPASWSSLQERLGRIHDLDVALSTVPAELAGSTPAQRLKEVRRVLRASVRLSLERIAARPKRVTARARLAGGQ